MTRRLAFFAVPVVALLALGLLVAPYLGFATPFAFPSSLHIDGRDYIGPGCHVLEQRERPLRRVGSVAGYFTSSRPVFVPHDEHVPAGQVPVVLFVRNGCLESYGLSGGP